MNFTYQSFSNKVYFGEGKIAQLPEIIKEMGATRLFVVAENRVQFIVDNLVETFGANEVLHFSKVIQHVPKSIVTEALTQANTHQTNLIIAIGGGSAIGLAKGIALENHLPILAIPTTYAGSEMTNVFGISENGVKTVGKDIAVLPKIVIYDATMTAGMPLSLAATSAMNAMAHLIEAVYAFDGNPIIYQIAMTGIKALKEGMEIMIQEKSLENANEKLQFGSYLAGKCLCEVSMALHHKLAHTLGGSFGMEHGEVHTVLLPYILNFQMPSLSNLTHADLEKALGSNNPAIKLRDLAHKMGANTTLKDIGFQEKDIPKAAEMVMNLKKFQNPVAISEQNIQALLEDCFYGKL
jgi:alcohol dehydrogenase class IV